MTTQLYGYISPVGVITGLLSLSAYLALPEDARDGIIPVPAETTVGSTFINGIWTHTYTGPPRSVEESGMSLSKVDQNTFKLLFTVPEEDATNRVASQYSLIKVMIDRAYSAENVNLLLPPVIQSLTMLAGLSGTLLVPSRLANILAGVYPTPEEQYVSALRHQYFYGVPGDPNSPGHGTPMPE